MYSEEFEAYLGTLAIDDKYSALALLQQLKKTPGGKCAVNHVVNALVTGNELPNKNAFKWPKGGFQIYRRVQERHPIYAELLSRRDGVPDYYKDPFEDLRVSDMCVEDSARFMSMIEEARKGLFGKYILPDKELTLCNIAVKSKSAQRRFRAYSGVWDRFMEKHSIQNELINQQCDAEDADYCEHFLQKETT